MTAKKPHKPSYKDEQRGTGRISFHDAKFALRIDRDLLERARQAAYDRRQHVSQFMRDAILKLVEEHEQEEEEG